MKKHILYSSVLLGMAAIATGCSENAWNDHLDGFDGNFNYTGKVNVSYTLTNSDYETIGSALEKVAATDEEIAAAKAIKANHYFDQHSVYPAQMALPYLFNDTSSDYFIYSDGSVVEATFVQAESIPEEISKISSANTYTIVSPVAASEIPGLLEARYPDAEEGDYSIVSYIDESTVAAVPVNVAPKAMSPKTMAKAFKTRAESNVWTVTEALANVNDGFEGEAVVIGTISQINDVSTSYGNATYFIKDNLNDADEASIEIYRGYSLDGENFTSEDEIVVGETVIVSGNLTVYNSTIEFGAGSAIVSKYSQSMWSVAEALGNMTNDSYEGEAIVKGVVSQIDDLSTSYGNATYYIKDSLKAEDSLEVFRGKYLDGEAFTSEDQLEVGATVVVYGELTNYNGTLEFTSGSSLLSYSTGSLNTGSDNLSSNIKDVTEGEVLSATAVVSAQCTRGLILTDNAGSILYYNPDVDLSAYPVGTVVEFSGEVSSYNKGYQLSSTATLKAIETMDYNYPSAEMYTADMITAAVEGTENMLAEYVAIEGVVSFSGNYTNIAITGTSVVGSAYYIPDALKDELVAGSNYVFYGYFTSFTSSYFYIVVTGFEEKTPDVDPMSFTNQVYYYDGSAWDVAENTAVIDPADYVKMGFSNNDLSDAEIYLPLYMKNAYPYAMPGDEVYVAYNLRTNSASCDLLVYDGSSWMVNNNNKEEVTASFTKSEGNWSFTKYLGKAIFDLYQEDEITLDRKYMLVSGSKCANPVVEGNNYGYLLTTSISVSGTLIVMANDVNGFSFLSTFEQDGNTYEVPEGYFIIKDTYDRYMYLQGSYSSFNVSDNVTITDGSIDQGFLFSATMNEDGSWNINNNRGDGNVRNVYYSSGYDNFAAYTEQGANDSLPFLYILEEE